MPTFYMTPYKVKAQNIYDNKTYGLFKDEKSNQLYHIALPIDKTHMLKENPAFVVYGELNSNSIKFGKPNLEIQSAHVPTSQDEFLDIFAAVKNLGPKSASKIYDALGPFAFEKILNNPAILNNMKLRGNVVHNLQTYIHNNKNELYAFSQYIAIGFSEKQALFIHKKLNYSFSKFLIQPYDLLLKYDTFLRSEHDEDIPKITFKKIDDIVIQKNLNINPQDRIKHAIKYAFETALPDYKNGDTIFINIEAAQYINSELLNNSFNVTDINNAIKTSPYLKAIGTLQYQAEKLYNQEYHLFTDIIERIDTLHSNIVPPATGQNNITLAPEQQSAIKNSIENKISIITGGPGTGKTTVLKTLINTLYQYELTDILLLAPTGRAAKRMREAIGIKSYTIHSTLYNVDHFLTKSADVQKTIIIDEASMIEGDIFAKLFSRIPHDARVILVGDADQLPPIGNGEHFKDLTDYNIIPTVKLITGQRQNASSSETGIAELITSVKNGDHIDVKNHKSLSVSIYDTYRIESSIIEQLETESTLNTTAHQTNQLAFPDLQIIVPYTSTKQSVSATRMNNSLQPIFNPRYKAIKDGHLNEHMYTKSSPNPDEITYFCRNDRVINIKNQRFPGDDPKHPIYITNGEIGQVLEVLHDKKSNEYALRVQFDDLTVTYNRHNIKTLLLAYAITIHKSQGSEFPNVIVAIPNKIRANDSHLTRNMLYTAVSRPKTELQIFGPETVLNQMIDNIPEPRNTRFKLLCENM